jgi:fucose 4-O-acetylase-like acetyltransferase
MGTLNDMQARARRQDLDRAKGLGIALVVIGHIVAKTPPQGNEWYVVLHTALYQFHMPFFMYLSGYVTFLSGAARTAPAAWPKLVASRAYRLLLPFFVFGLATVAGKMIVSRFIHIDSPPSSVTEALGGLFWDTDRSPAISVWYIAVLFVFCVATPLILRLLGNRTRALFVLGAVLCSLRLPHVMYLDTIAHFYLFFILGGMAADAGQGWLDFVDRFTWLSLGALLLAVIAVLGPLDGLSRISKLLICGSISMPALHGLIRKPIFSDSRMLLTLGTFSFVIYLLNTPCIGLTKGMLLKVASWDGANFLIFAPCLTVAGLLGPILIKRWLLRPLGPLDRITN